jgi:hypothetical protein
VPETAQDPSVERQLQTAEFQGHLHPTQPERGKFCYGGIANVSTNGTEDRGFETRQEFVRCNAVVLMT